MMTVYLMSILMQSVMKTAFKIW